MANELASGAKSSDSSKNVARVRVTPAGNKNTADFKGKVFSSEGDTWAGSAEDLAALDADPKFVVERFGKDGELLKRTGEPYKGVPAAKPVRKHSDDLA